VHKAKPSPRALPVNKSLAVVGLFAGIGGIERGMVSAGHRVVGLCEIDPSARLVLREQFPRTNIANDVRELDLLPQCDVIAAGFPCQDLSQAGGVSGIRGKQSSLVTEVFRLIGTARRRPRWLILENVPFMLRLDRGRALWFLTKELRSHGYSWAYRTVDSRSFGLPQRRKRVILVASPSEDPREILFADEAGGETNRKSTATAYGFYWTEGNNGLGWAPDAVPTLKGGSTVGIPSPPAIWIPTTRRIVTPDLRDAERLQGFPTGWTQAADSSGARKGTRWRLIGNSVSVPIARWLGERFAKPGTPRVTGTVSINLTCGWPDSAWGTDGKVFEADVSQWPVRTRLPRLLDFLRYPTSHLSPRATSGFLCRARASRLRFQEGFLDDVAWHLGQMDPDGLYPERKY
jgi:DNA (cytosine-5)-methyltransferase 1